MSKCTRCGKEIQASGSEHMWICRICHSLSQAETNQLLAELRERLTDEDKDLLGKMLLIVINHMRIKKEDLRHIWFNEKEEKKIHGFIETFDFNGKLKKGGEDEI